MYRTQDTGTHRSLDARDGGDSYARAMADARAKRTGSTAERAAPLLAFVFAGVGLGAVAFGLLAAAGVL